MSDSQITDPRRKRILYRATHRGTKESDAIVGGFFSENTGGLAEGRLAEVEEFLELSDLDLIDWIMGRKAVPARWRGSILDDIISWERERRAR